MYVVYKSTRNLMTGETRRALAGTFASESSARDSAALLNCSAPDGTVYAVASSDAAAHLHIRV